jgi:hypothetical protein
MLKGRSVFFIQKRCMSCESKMKSIPESGARLRRNIRPSARSSGLLTISTKMRASLTRSSTDGRAEWRIGDDWRGDGRQELRTRRMQMADCSR